MQIQPTIAAALAASFTFASLASAQEWRLVANSSASLVWPGAIFDVASTTRVCVARAVCQRAADGRLSLDDRVDDHQSRFELAGHALESSVTIRDLPLHIEATGPDAFQHLTGFSADGRFILSDSGRVEAVRLESERFAVQTFRR